jgi:hypothetical protein
LGKRSITLGGRQKSQSTEFSTTETIAHLERNFSNILMLVTRSLEALSDAFSKSKSKNEDKKAIDLSRQLVANISEVNVVITKVTNQCDGKTKIATPSTEPDSVEEGLSIVKHTLSVLLPKFNKMIAASKLSAETMDKIELGLLDHIDEAMSDASECMDNLVTWLKDAGFGDAANTVMLAMRWKAKAFGGAKKRGKRHFGSIRIAPGGSLLDDATTSSGSAGADNKIVSDALASAQAEAVTEQAADEAASAAAAAAA